MMTQVTTLKLRNIRRSLNDSLLIIQSYHASLLKLYRIITSKLSSLAITKDNVRVCSSVEHLRLHFSLRVWSLACVTKEGSLTISGLDALALSWGRCTPTIWVRDWCPTWVVNIFPLTIARWCSLRYWQRFHCRSLLRCQQEAHTQVRRCQGPAIGRSVKFGCVVLCFSCVSRSPRNRLPWSSWCTHLASLLILTFICQSNVSYRTF